MNISKFFQKFKNIYIPMVVKSFLPSRISIILKRLNTFGIQTTQP